MRRGGPPPSFAVVWLAILVWNAYWFLARSVYEIGVVDGSRLTWKTVLSQGECAAADVVSIDTFIPIMTAGVKAIRVRGRSSPLVWVSGGFGDLTRDLRSFLPGVPIQVGMVDRVGDRASFPGSWGWSASDDRVATHTG